MTVMSSERLMRHGFGNNRLYNQRQEEANAYADEMNDLQREANETAAKARRDMNIANAANIYQNHKRNKMLGRMNKK